MSCNDAASDDLYSLDNDDQIKPQNNGDHASAKMQPLETVLEAEEHRERGSIALRTPPKIPAKSLKLASLKRMRSTPIFPSVSEILEGHDKVRKNHSLDLDRKRGRPLSIPPRRRQPLALPTSSPCLPEIELGPTILSPLEVPTMLVATLPPADTDQADIPPMPRRPPPPPPRMPSRTASSPTSPHRSALYGISRSREHPNRAVSFSPSAPSPLRHARSFTALGNVVSRDHSDVAEAKRETSIPIRIANLPSLCDNALPIRHRRPHGLMPVLENLDATDRKAPASVVEQVSKAPEQSNSRGRLRSVGLRWFVKVDKVSGTSPIMPPDCVEAPSVYDAQHENNPQVSNLAHNTRTLPRSEPRQVTPFWNTRVVEYYAPGGRHQFETRVSTMMYG